MTKPRLLICDDHELITMGLASSLAEKDEFTILPPVNTPDTLLKLITDEPPEVLILDLGLPGRSGLSVLTELRHMNINTKVVVVSGQASGVDFARALDLGAHGLVCKNEPATVVYNALSTVLRGEQYLSPGAEALIGPLQARQADNDELWQGLTPRERDVLTLIGQGMSNKAVGRILHISPATAKKHRENLMRKLDVHSAVDIARKAYELGLSSVQQ